MVGEFPELQGIMGRYYAINDEGEEVANAIADHYKPLGPNDTCPMTPTGTIVALADKLDALAAFFWVGERPTGSSDPFALRRAALGIIRIVLEKNLQLPLTSVLAKATDPTPRFQPEQVMKNVRALMDFIGDRLWVHLRGEGVRRDLIAAVFSVREDNLVRLLARVGALQNFLETDDGANLLTAYRRASNIVSIEEKRDQRPYHDNDFDPQLGSEDEISLWRALNSIAPESRKLVDSGEFEPAMAALATLRRPVDEFFDKVTVNADDRALRENRLRLLSRIRSVMNQVADFSQIEG